MGDTTHKDHRARMKERLLKHGLESFHDHEVLEILLYFSVPRIDTNPIAHELMDKFGSLHAVIEANAEALKEVKGIGENSIALITFFRQFMARYATDKEEYDLKFASMDTSEKIGRYLKPRFIDKDEEHLVAMATDIKGKVLGVEEISKGGIRTTNINIRKLVEFALKYNASGIILAHNHPGGLAIPSDEDLNATRIIQEALMPMDIVVRDHIIIAGNDFISLKDSNMMQYVNVLQSDIHRRYMLYKKPPQRCASSVLDINKKED